ncbi:Protein FAR1-RELATED SEQUENCE 5 [Ananas comosus]|uniref:Protein FAR1-RELATED SEQUENCE 5 n=1 Tax=Ananas comosus TaxID=4615 RepID=A0A199VWV3_ANACO|nr:Protein FAR1-RELATED SEQUENCE 5 [Ananas comosus]
MEDCSVIGSTSSLASLPNVDASIDEFNIVEIEELEENIPGEQVYETEEKDSEPYLGQEFRFSIRKSTHYRAKKQDNMITSVTYTCSKEGQYNSKLTTQEKGDHENLQNDNTSKKEISLRRTGCKAHMRVRLVNTTKWTVTTFTKEHNHELIASPSKALFLDHTAPSQRNKRN